MSKVGRSDVLRPLARLLRLTGTRTTPEEVDIDRPLNPVVDVGGWAGALGQLYVAHGIAVATGGAGAAATSIVEVEDDIAALATVAPVLRNLGIREDYWAWICDFQAYGSSTANLASCSASFDYPASKSNFFQTGSNALDPFLGFGNTTVARATAAGPEPIVHSTNSTVFPFAHTRSSPLPQRLARVNIRTQDNAGGAVSLSYQMLICFTPPGVKPSWPLNVS